MDDILNKGQQIQGVDVGKYIMALGVVAIHVSSSSCTGILFPRIINWFIYLAVPFFFIVSGFLLIREISDLDVSEKRKYLGVRLKKITKLYALWLLIYLPISIIHCFSNKIPLKDFFSSLIASILIRGEIMYAWPLWFLYSLLIITLGLYLTVRYKIMNFVFWIFVCIFYVIGQIFHCIDHSLLSEPIIFIYKILPIRVISGGIYVLFGFFLYRTCKRITSVLILSLVLLIISILLYVYNLPCYELVGGGCIFLYCTKINLNNNLLSKSLRNQSMWIYYLHMYIIYFIVEYAINNNRQLQLWPTFVTVLGITIIIAYILSKLQTVPKFKFLNVLTA